MWGSNGKRCGKVCWYVGEVGGDGGCGEVLGKVREGVLAYGGGKGRCGGAEKCVGMWGRCGKVCWGVGKVCWYVWEVGGDVGGVGKCWEKCEVCGGGKGRCVGNVEKC